MLTSRVLPYNNTLHNSFGNKLIPHRRKLSSFRFLIISLNISMYSVLLMFDNNTRVISIYLCIVPMVDSQIFKYFIVIYTRTGSVWQEGYHTRTWSCMLSVLCNIRNIVCLDTFVKLLVFYEYLKNTLEYTRTVIQV